MRLLHISYLLLLYGLFHEDVHAREAEKRLMSDIFSKDNHNIMVRPVMNSSDSLNVTLSLSIYKLAEIIEMTQEVDFSVWLTTKWTDYQMRWDPEKYDGIKRINIRPDKVWLPDIVLYNNAHEDNSEYGGNMDTLKTRIKVNHTGDMFWKAPLFLRAKCYIKVNQFPFDTQVCYLKFGSWTYSISELNLLPGGIDTSNFLPCSEWNLKEVHTDYHLQQHHRRSGELYPDLVFKMTFERKSLFYVTNLIFPMTVITILTMLTFILPNESGERIGFSVELLLATTFFMLLVSETTPDSSESLPIVTHFFIFCLLIVFSIIIFLCLISRVYNRGPTDRPMSKWVRRWILNYLSFVLHIRRSDMKNRDKKMADMEHTPSSTSSIDSKLLEEVNMKEIGVVDEQSDSPPLTIEEEWRIVAMTMDFILFIVYVCIFIIGTLTCFAHAKFVGSKKYKLLDQWIFQH